MKPCLMSAALVALLVLAGCGGGGGSPSTSSSDAPSAPITPSTPDAVTESAQRDAQQTTSAFAEVLQSDVEFGSVTLAAGVGTLSGGARTRTSFSGNNLTVRIDAAGGSGSGILNRSQKAWTKRSGIAGHELQAWAVRGGVGLADTTGAAVLVSADPNDPFD